MKKEFKNVTSSCDEKVDLTKKYGFNRVELVYGIGEKQKSVFINANEIETITIDNITKSKHLIADGILFPFISCDGFKIVVKKELIDNKLYEQLLSLRTLSFALVHYIDNSLDVFRLPNAWYVTDIDGKSYEFNVYQETSEEYNESKNSTYIIIEVKSGEKHYDCD